MRFSPHPPAPPPSPDTRPIAGLPALKGVEYAQIAEDGALEAAVSDLPGDRDRELVVPKRLLYPALLTERYTKVEMGHRVVRFEACRLTELADRLVHVLLGDQRRTEVEVGLCVHGVQCERLAVVPNGLIERAHALIRTLVRKADGDRPPAPDIVRLADALAAGDFDVITDGLVT